MLVATLAVQAVLAFYLVLADHWYGHALYVNINHRKQELELRGQLATGRWGFSVVYISMTIRIAPPRGQETLFLRVIFGGLAAHYWSQFITGRHFSTVSLGLVKIDLLDSIALPSESHQLVFVL